MRPVLQSRFAIASVLAAALASVSLPAQTNLNLRDAIDLALKDNSRLMIAREKVRESGLRVKESWGRLWPDLSIEVSRTCLDAEKGLSSFSGGEGDIKFVKGSLTVNPGAFYASLLSSRDGYVIAVNDERRTRADTVVRTVELYTRCFLAGETVILASNSLRSLEANLKVATASFESGSGVNLDRLRAGVVVANQRTRLIMARNDLRTSRAALNAHLGRSWNRSFAIDVHSMKVDENEVAGYTNLSDAAIDSRLDQLTAEALKNRPENLQVRLKKKAAVDAARASESFYLFPTLFAGGSLGSSLSIAKKGSDLSALGPMASEFSPRGWFGNSSLTIGASYRFGALAPWDSGHARAGESRSQARQADLELEDLAKNVRVEVQQKFFKLVSAAAVILSQKDNIRTSEEYFRIAVIQFQNGVIDNSRLLSADLELQNAKTMYIQALFDFQTAKADLNRAVGADLFQF